MSKWNPGKSQPGKWNPADEYLTPKQKHETRKRRWASREASAKVFAQVFFRVEQGGEK